MSDATLYPDARIDAAAAYIVDIIEREVGTSFVSRTVTDEIHDGGGCEMVLKKPFVLSVGTATENAVAVTDTLVASNVGVLRRFAAGSYVAKTWLPGAANVKVTYASGYSAAPPADVKEAALRATRAYLLETSSNAGVLDRRSTISNDLGGTTTYVIAGAKSPTGYPQVDAVILGWKARLYPLGCG